LGIPEGFHRYAADRKVHVVLRFADQGFDATYGIVTGHHGTQRLDDLHASAGVTDQTYYRLRKEYGGLQLEQAKTPGDAEGKRPAQARPAYLTLGQIDPHTARGSESDFSPSALRVTQKRES